tara:strand:- start:942 stop:1406 length:465 start_codon:yes stop_codon:yes gene_type:complete
MEKVFLTIEEVIDSIRKILEQINKLNFDPEVVIGINRGGCIPSICISHYLNKPHEVLNIGFRDSYKKVDLVKIQDQLNQFKSALIIDDINDSGKTIGVIKDLCNNLKTNIHFAVLINNSESLSSVNYYGKMVNLKFKHYWYVFPWENWWNTNEK